jgi:phosphonoacetate hydrolase
MDRRYFLFGSLGAAAPRVGPAAQRRKILITLWDGFGPEYLEKSDLPNLRRMPVRVVKGLLPSVTNVNNASLATGTFPDEHGITTNFYYDQATGKSAEMKSPQFLLRPTILEKAAARGWKTALVSSKDKIAALCSRGAQVVVSAEKPEARFLAFAGAKENMYTPAVNYWSFRAARHLLKREAMDIVYLSTTDYMMHTHPAESAASLEHLHTLDKMLGEIAGDHPALEIYLTADHGMNAKTTAVDPVRLLREQKVEAAAAPLISDNHKAHHQDLGGSYYIFLARKSDTRRAIEVLRQAPEVEDAYAGDEAARLFRLKRDRIGDLFLLARKHMAFGDLETLRKPVHVRTHGSRHEAAVPVAVLGRKINLEALEYNLDLTRNLELERV